MFTFYLPHHLPTFTYWYSNMDIRRMQCVQDRAQIDEVDKI